MKYIDADLLRKDIDNWKEAMADAVGEYSDGVRFALEHFTFVLDSLQQEQPEVDLEKKIDDYFCSIERWQVEEEPYRQLDKCARHFYELG